MAAATATTIKRLAALSKGRRSGAIRGAFPFGAQFSALGVNER
jgi:hypothetical protein